MPNPKWTTADLPNLSGKTVIDCTNPLKADLSGLDIGHTTSAGERVAGWARGAKVFKASRPRRRFWAAAACSFMFTKAGRIRPRDSLAGTGWTISSLTPT